MDDRERWVDGLFRSAQAAARAGRKSEARRRLWAALRLAPDRAELWIWLAGVTPSPRASMGYLARALILDPGNAQARAGVRWLRGQAAGSPHLTVRVPAPERSPGGRKVQTGRRGRRYVLAAGLLMMAIAVAGLQARMSVLAAGKPTPVVANAKTPAPPVLAALPTLTAELPPTWTPTHTTTPSCTPSATPTATPSPTETPTPAYPSPTWVPTGLPSPVPVASSANRWIDVDLTQQLLVAYEGNTPVRWVLVSAGLPGTPTVVGQFQIYVKYESTLMVGDDYYLPNVPYTMYFYKGFGLHGTYWHTNFGRPMSHGCINLPTPEAEWLYQFASIGTLVNVHY